MILDGKIFQKEILDSIKARIKKIKDKIVLGIVLVGENEESLKFISEKKKIADILNIEVRIYKLDENIKKRKLREFIKNLIRRKYPQGVLIQLPLPNHLNEQYFLNALWKKDIEALSKRKIGEFFSNFNINVINPPAVKALDFILNKIDFDPKDKIALVLGYGKLVGRFICHYLRERKANVISIHRIDETTRDFLKRADVIVSGVGCPKIVDDCKDGAILIDFGYKIINGKIYGDLDIEKINKKALYYTPTPGGTGPILIAMLFENLVKLVEENSFRDS